MRAFFKKAFCRHKMWRLLPGSFQRGQSEGWGMVNQTCSNCGKVKPRKIDLAGYHHLMAVYGTGVILEGTTERCEELLAPNIVSANGG